MLANPGSANLIRAVSSQILSISKDRDFAGFLCSLADVWLSSWWKNASWCLIVPCCNLCLLLGVAIFSVCLPSRLLKTAVTTPQSSLYRLNQLTSLSLSSCNPIIIFGGPLLNSFQCVSIFLILGSPKLGTGLLVWCHKRREKIASLSVLLNMVLCMFGHEVTLTPL